MRELWQFVVAVYKHSVFALTGTVIAVALVLWPHISRREIPDRPFWGLVALSFLWATFLAWRDEHRRVAQIGDEEQREEQRRLSALASKMVDEYVGLARPRHDAGPSALSRLGLHALKSDALIREAIQEMQARSNTDPWSGLGHVVDDVDLVKFFERVHKMKFDFLRDGTVEGVAKNVKEASGHRPKEPNL